MLSFSILAVEQFLAQFAEKNKKRGRRQILSIYSYLSSENVSKRNWKFH